MSPPSIDPAFLSLPLREAAAAALQAGALQQALNSPGLAQALSSQKFSEAMRMRTE